eukprot:15363802-Heterocapsa_arctica.AAC.1
MRKGGRERVQKGNDRGELHLSEEDEQCRKGKEKEGEEEQVDGQECRLDRQESRLDPKGAT